MDKPGLMSIQSVTVTPAQCLSRRSLQLLQTRPAKTSSRCLPHLLHVPTVAGAMTVPFSPRLSIFRSDKSAQGAAHGPHSEIRSEQWAFAFNVAFGLVPEFA